MRDWLRGLPIVLAGGLLLVVAGLQQDGTTRTVVGTTGLTVVVAWVGARLSHWRDTD